MGGSRVHILVAEPSLIIRRGVLSVLLDIDFMGIDITDVEDISHLGEEIVKYQPDIVLVNPLHLGMMQPQALLTSVMNIKFIALQNYISTSDQLKSYDAVISVSSSSSQIEEILEKVVGSTTSAKDDELSLREKEVVRAIALGRSNKEIADDLCISTHTVMTHRKNIASKLKIHNSAGITIYAIVNKIIDIGDVT
ncbi:MAG: LuxR C-terminal-related transcriptional regulator [Rikenellaceae bacterium]